MAGKRQSRAQTIHTTKRRAPPERGGEDIALRGYWDASATNTTPTKEQTAAYRRWARAHFEQVCERIGHKIPKRFWKRWSGRTIAGSTAAGQMIRS